MCSSPLGRTWFASIYNPILRMRRAAWSPVRSERGASPLVVFSFLSSQKVMPTSFLLSPLTRKAAVGGLWHAQQCTVCVWHAQQCTVRVAMIIILRLGVVHLSWGIFGGRRVGRAAIGPGAVRRAEAGRRRQLDLGGWRRRERHHRRRVSRAPITTRFVGSCKSSSQPSK